LVGLSEVSVDGTPIIAGDFPSVFSNVLVGLVGTGELGGDAISGGSVSVSGTPSIGGSVIEGAAPILVPDPTADVLAAKENNDNANIPCLPQGANCKVVVNNYALELNNTESLILPAGTYYFESIAINGLASLGTDGDVVIYLNGPATFNGGSATDPENDSLLLISASSADIKLNGGSESEMHIFAPFAEVNFSGTQGFTGTAIADVLSISGTADLDVNSDLTGLWDMECASNLPGLPDQPD
jgi:hypothetical protein